MPQPNDHLPSASLEMLRLRSRALGVVRRFFEAHGYWEVDTPVLSHDIVVDVHLEPFVTDWNADTPLFLQTSPEFGMKRLLAAGADAIYQISHVMRRGELGRFHNPEFVMIEWYRVSSTHHQQMDVVEELVAQFYDEISDEISRSAVSGHRCTAARVPVRRPFLRLTYDAAFERVGGTKVLELSTQQLAELARERGVVPPESLHLEDRDGWLNLLMAELIQPQLGLCEPAFVYDFPASQAALAQIRDDHPPVAERFELFHRGIELCNGYHELTDAAELRKRTARQAAERRQLGLRDLPRESRLLAAMESGLPPCSGVALGFDRLLMLAADADSVSQVLPFPFDRA